MWILISMPLLFLIFNIRPWEQNKFNLAAASSNRCINCLVRTVMSNDVLKHRKIVHFFPTDVYFVSANFCKRCNHPTINLEIRYHILDEVCPKTTIIFEKTDLILSCSILNLLDFNFLSSL